MIPVRVPADTQPLTVGGIRTLDPSHPLFFLLCPVCDGELVDSPVTLVCVGIAPEDRKPGGWTNGGAVVVHAICAGLEPEDGGAENAL